MIKNILKVVFIICNIIFIYLFVGNLYRGLTSPVLIGDRNGHFLGYYMITIAYFILIMIFTVIIVLLFKIKKSSKKS